MWQKREAAVNAFELVSGNLEIVAAIELNKFNASGLDAAFVDLVESVDVVADHVSVCGALSGLN